MKNRDMLTNDVVRIAAAPGRSQDFRLGRYSATAAELTPPSEPLHRAIALIAARPDCLLGKDRSYAHGASATAKSSGHIALDVSGAWPSVCIYLGRDGPLVESCATSAQMPRKAVCTTAYSRPHRTQSPLGAPCQTRSTGQVTLSTRAPNKRSLLLKN